MIHLFLSIPQILKGNLESQVIARHEFLDLKRPGSRWNVMQHGMSGRGIPFADPDNSWNAPQGWNSISTQALADQDSHGTVRGYLS
jgi:hypothetical protein